jgi:hypothetical protein
MLAATHFFSIKAGQAGQPTPEKKELCHSFSIIEKDVLNRTGLEPTYLCMIHVFTRRTHYCLS